MAFIHDFLFGKEITYTDSKLGELKTRTRKFKANAQKVWMGELLIAGQKSKTVILLDGSAEKPSDRQINAMHKLIDSVTEIHRKAESVWRRNPEHTAVLDDDWLNHYYLAAINPLDAEENSFELSYEPDEEKAIEGITLIWKNSRITETED